MTQVLKDEFSSILREFPSGMCYAFAYGSGAFQQSGHKSVKDNMVDFIFVVDNALAWHRKNMLKFRDHYPLIRIFGPRVISAVQQNNFGVPIYYNVFVSVNNCLLKYGVITRKDLLHDLQTWEHLFIAGRLHKPVMPLFKPCEDLQLALTLNLRNALRTALLLLPATFTEKDLYIMLCGLSYEGDVRMIIFEDKRKVLNIVEPNLAYFRELYKPIYRDFDCVCESNSVFKQDISPKKTFGHLSNLPFHLKRRLPGVYRERNFDDTALNNLAMNREKMTTDLSHAIKSIVGRSTKLSVVKMAAYSGISRAVQYSLQKFYKMTKSLVK